MADNCTLVRASDIGLWTYCHRAWWLARVRKASHRYPERLSQGTIAHETHGQTVARAQRYRQWAERLLALGLLLMGVALLVWLMQS